MKKILITGGLGFIGSNLALKCASEGMEVTVYDNLDENSGCNVHNISQNNDNIQIVQGDILDYNNLCNYIRGAEVIINCAASCSHLLSMREPFKNLEVNSRGVLNILEAMRSTNPSSTLVHVGTTSQLGPLHAMPASELHPEFPLDIYSANKVVAEKYVLIYAKSHGLNTSVVRLPAVYGPRAAIHSSHYTFINYFVGLALKGAKITVYGEGDQLRNVLYASDAVDALMSAASSEESRGNTILATGDQHLSVLDIAEQVCEVFGGHVERVPWPTDAKRIEVGHSVFDNAKAKSLLGWRPLVNFKDGLTLTKDYMDKYLHHYI